MRYKIDYLSREKDMLLRVLEGEEHLSDIKNARYIAKTLCRELQELYDELNRCINALENGIRELQMQIGQAEQAARGAQMRDLQISAKLQSMSDAKGARQGQVHTNREESARLKGEIARCKEEARRQQQRIEALQEKLKPLQRDMAALKSGLDRVDGYLNIAQEADMRLETAYREAEYKCEEVVSDILKIEDLMERYDEVNVKSSSYGAVPHIRQKEGW